MMPALRTSLRFLQPAFFALLLVAGCPLLLAQTPTVSIGGGREGGETLIEFEKRDSLRFKQDFDGSAHAIIGFLELSVPFFTVKDVLLAVRTSWYDSHFSLSSPVGQIQVLIGSGHTFGGGHERLSFNMRTIQLELIGQLAVTQRLKIGLGPTIGYRSIGDYRLVQDIDTTWYEDYPPPFEVIPDGVIDDGSMVDENSLSLGAILNVGYELPVGDRLSIVPELRLRSDLLSPFPDTGWEILSVGGTIGLMYSL